MERPAPQTEPFTEHHNEPFYTRQIAAQFGWRAEVTTSIGTRCDLVSPQYAIEVEWPRKAYEAIGQSGHYSIALEKRPAVLFLLSGQSISDREYVLERIGDAARQWDIEIWWYDTLTGSLERP